MRCVDDAEVLEALWQTTERLIELIDQSRQLRVRSEELIEHSWRARRGLGRLVAQYEQDQLRPAA